MKTFVVSQSVVGSTFPVSAEALSELTSKLAQIDLEPGKTNQIVAITDTYDLSHVVQAAGEHAELKAYCLDDFRCHAPQQVQSINEMGLIDSNVLAATIQADKTPWLIINLEHNGPASAVDLIKKLSRFAFLANGIPSKTLVLLVPGIFVGQYARYLNEGFNNLPVSPIDIDRSGQLSVMFMSTTMEKLFLSIPLLTMPIRRLNQLFMHVFQRLVRQN